MSGGGDILKIFEQKFINGGRQMKQVIVAIVVVAMIVLFGQSASAEFVFSANFENGVPPVFSGGTRTSTEGYDSYGFENYYYWDDNKEQGAITLHLSDLPQHNTIDLTFYVAIIDSWDGNTHRNQDRWPAPDYLNVSIDNNEVFHETFDNYEGLDDQSYDGPYLVYQAALARNSGFNDSAYIIKLKNISHSANDLNIKWYVSGNGWQGGWDESYAIDNISVSAVPIPAAAWLLGSGLLGLVAMRKKSGVV